MKKLLLFISFFIITTASYSQLQIRFGALKTDNKQTAIAVGISFIRSLDSIWKSKELYVAGKHSIFTVNPQFKIETGTQDAFSSIEGKLTGLFMSFKTKTLTGTSVVIPDLSKNVNAYPISVGFESNNTFSVINALAEVGWSPWYQSATSSTAEILKYTKFGIYIQGGYKFKGDSTATQITGGSKDESGEKVNNALLRTKGSFSIDTKKVINVSGINVGLVGNADVWYDFVNSQVYHKIEAVGRFYLADGQFFDVLYSKGSGAPNFNQGDQYGLGFTIKF